MTRLPAAFHPLIEQAMKLALHTPFIGLSLDNATRRENQLFGISRELLF